MNIHFEIQDDGIAHVIFDRKDSAANIFDEQTGRELSEHIDAIAANPTIKGVVFLSAKDTIFIAGADINAFVEQQGSEEELIEMLAEEWWKIPQSTIEKLYDGMPERMRRMAANHGGRFSQHKLCPKE